MNLDSLGRALPFFCFIGKFLLYKAKTPPGDRTAVEWNCVADATSRRRRISPARFFVLEARAARRIKPALRIASARIAHVHTG